jgi:phosphoglycerate dehydrogenase-like enzyme
MIRIAVTELEYRKARDVFAAAEGLECLPAPAEEAALAAFIKEHDAAHAVIGVEPYRDALYDALPRGGVIARFGVGMDGVDRAKAAERGLVCTNTPGALDDSVAECAIGLMMSAARQLSLCAAECARGAWVPRLGFELAGKSLAIIGCGHIGVKTAAIARGGFRMRVIGHDIRRPAEEEVFDVFAPDFEQAVRDADIVSLHVPDCAATKDLINAETLEPMPSRAILINTARGGVLDENALFDAIASGRLAGAGLDVFKTEPYAPADPARDLRTLEQVVMTPHIGSSTREACRRMAAMALAGILSAAARSPA